MDTYMQYPLAWADRQNPSAHYKPNADVIRNRSTSPWLGTNPITQINGAHSFWFHVIGQITPCTYHLEVVHILTPYASEKGIDGIT
jgi:hypothetical protein